MTTWTFQKKLGEKVSGAATSNLKKAAEVLQLEFNRLAKQKCPYCDGFGHAGNDCPTDKKIAQMRGGVLEQTQVLTAIRKECRELAGMGKVTGFSLLTPHPSKSLLGKRLRSDHWETMSADNGYCAKRKKFGP